MQDLIIAADDTHYKQFLWRGWVAAASVQLLEKIYLRMCGMHGSGLR